MKINRSTLLLPNIFTLLLLIYLLILHHSAHALPYKNDNASPYHNLDEWLEQLSVTLPPIVMKRKIAGIHTEVTISDFSCQAFSIDGIRSTIERNTFSSIEKVTFAVDHAAVKQCKGKWHATPIPIGGGFSFGIDNVMFGNTVTFNPYAENGDVIMAPENTCTNAFQLVNLKFTGGEMSKIVQFLAKEMKSVVEKAVEHFACQLPGKAFQTISQKIDSFLDTPSTPNAKEALLPTLLKPEHNKRFVEWGKDVPILKNIPIPEKLAAMANNILEEKNGYLGKKMEGALTNSKETVVKQYGELLFSSIPGLEVKLNLRDIAIELNDFESISLLQAIKGKPYSMHIFSFELKKISIKLEAGILLKPLNDGLYFHGSPLQLKCKFAADVENVSGNIEAFVTAFYDIVNQITLEELMHQENVQKVMEIIANVFHSSSISNISLTFRLSNAEVSPIQLGDPEITEILNVLNNLMTPFFDSDSKKLVTTSSARKSFSNCAENVFLLDILPLAQKTLNQHINYSLTLLKELARDAPPLYNISAKGRLPLIMSSSAISFTSALIFSTFFFTLTLYATCLSKYTFITPIDLKLICKKNEDWKTSNNTNYEELGNIESCNTNRSLAFLYRKNTSLKFLFPLLHMGNMAVGIWSIFTPICNVQLKIIGGIVDPAKLMLDDSLLVYTFWGMINDFWSSKSYLICISLLLGGCVLPQTKGILTMYCWVVPTHKSTRGWILFVTDILGRFAFVNQFFIAIMTIALRADIVLQGLTIEVTAQPVFGIISGTVGTTFMMLLSTWTMYLHNNAYNDAERNGKLSNVETTNRLAAQIPVPVEAEFTNKLATISFATSLVSGIFYIYGLQFYGLSLDMIGLAQYGEMVKGSKTSPDKTYYILSLPGIFYNSTNIKIAALLIASVYFFIILVMPIVVWLFSVAEWFYVLRFKQNPRKVDHKNGVMKHISSCTQYMYSWVGLEVLCAAFYSSSLEMNNVVNWVVQKQFGNVCNAFHSAIGISCLHINGTVGPGFFLPIIFCTYF
jgi:hypothetical protein